jgi:hypothetical protein
MNHGLLALCSFSFSFFALVIFQIESQTFCYVLASDRDPPTYASLISGITDINHLVWLVR